MKLWVRFRSAITGRFVSRLYALLHPKTTVAETRPDPFVKSLGEPEPEQ